MIERRGEKVVLTTPITAEDLVNLRIGEIIYLDGDLVTCRDVVHRRLICGGRQLPVNLEGGAIFHAGPIVRPMADQEGNYEMVSVGPTTSMRMERKDRRKAGNWKRRYGSRHGGGMSQISGDPLRLSCRLRGAGRNTGAAYSSPLLG